MAKNVQSLVKAKIEVDGMRNIIFNALPQNITNGDVIRMMFPNVRCIENGNSITLYFDKKVGTIITHDWWNAPYKN